MAQSVFGCQPIVLGWPYRGTLRSSSPAGFTIIITTCNRRIADAFASRGSFWLNDVPTRNLAVDGFSVQPSALPVADQKTWQRIAPTTLVHDEGAPAFATDDWPFLYLHGRLIPNLSLRSMLLLGALGLAMVYVFLPKERALSGRRLRIDARMFFLGAAFMLLETKAVVQLALLFGSTWLVNSLVFAAVLILILLANLYVLRQPGVRLLRHYAELLALLAIGALVPTDVFLGGGILWRYMVPCALALGPMFFAGVIFARSFRDARDPDEALGANIAGSVVGGFSESFSLLLGFRYLLLLAAAFYLLSAWAPSWRLRKAP
jgi:hypothetical protein